MGVNNSYNKPGLTSSFSKGISKATTRAYKRATKQNLRASVRDLKSDSIFNKRSRRGGGVGSANPRNSKYDYSPFRQKASANYGGYSSRWDIINQFKMNQQVGAPVVQPKQPELTFGDKLLMGTQTVSNYANSVNGILGTIGQIAGLFNSGSIAGGDNSEKTSDKSKASGSDNPVNETGNNSNADRVETPAAKKSENIEDNLESSYSLKHYDNLSDDQLRSKLTKPDNGADLSNTLTVANKRLDEMQTDLSNLNSKVDNMDTKEAQKTYNNLRSEFDTYRNNLKDLLSKKSQNPELFANAIKLLEARIEKYEAEIKKAYGEDLKNERENSIKGEYPEFINNAGEKYETCLERDALKNDIGKLQDMISNKDGSKDGTLSGFFHRSVNDFESKEQRQMQNAVDRSNRRVKKEKVYKATVDTKATSRAQSLAMTHASQKGFSGIQGEVMVTADGQKFKAYSENGSTVYISENGIVSNDPKLKECVSILDEIHNQTMENIESHP